MACGLDGHTPPPLLVERMTADTTHGWWTLADGSRFRWGPNTVLVELAGVDVGVEAHTLHVNDTQAMLTPPRGTIARPWRISPRVALEIVDKVNAARVGTDRPPVKLPRIFMRTARHVAAVEHATFGGLPFPLVDAAGYPGRNTPAETLWVHRPTGAVVLEVDTRPARLTPTEAATTLPTKTYARIGVRAAIAWLDREGYPFRPAELMRRRMTGADDDPQPGVGPGGP
jgi:hypothetical protein